jgi:hypothetical protein
MHNFYHTPAARAQMAKATAVARAATKRIVIRTLGKRCVKRCKSFVEDER